MNWLIQDNDELFGDFIAAVDAEPGENRVIVNHRFWEMTIDLKTTGMVPKSIIPFGTRSFVRYAINNEWTVPWNDEYQYYTLLSLGDEFINHDMQVGPLNSLKISNTGKIYVREAAGFNIIKGKVIDANMWPHWVESLQARNNPADRLQYDWHPIDGDSLFVCAPVKTIIDEYRVWVIGGRVVTSSQYINKGDIKYTNSDDNWEVNQYAQKMADRFGGVFGVDNYVIDIFHTDKGLRVGEVNCMCCSGWYAINAQKAVSALASYYKGL